jgi:hypothetical protein
MTDIDTQKASHDLPGALSTSITRTIVFLTMSSPYARPTLSFFHSFTNRLQCCTMHTQCFLVYSLTPAITF